MTIPVHIIAGFLGSGKTTLMNRLLKALPETTNAAVIVNDFGEIPLDGTLIDQGDYAMKELPSGCVCCTLKGPLSDALTALAEDVNPDVILMETTGVAVPMEIAGNFRSAALHEIVRVGNIICLVDAGSFLRYEKHYDVLGKQVMQANTLVLNKVDIASPDVLKATRHRLEYLRQPDAVLIETRHSNVGINTVLEVRPVFFPFTPVGGHAHFLSVSIEESRISDPGRLMDFLRALGDPVARAKGIVRTSQGTKLVQWTLSGCDISDWNGAVESSRFVCIGKDLDGPALIAAFKQTLL